MGKGDKKTTKGKRFKGSYGVSRPRKSGKKAYVPKRTKTKKVEAPAEEVEEVVVAEESKPKKAPAKKAAAKKPAKKAAAKKPATKAASKKAKK